MRALRKVALDRTTGAQELADTTLRALERASGGWRFDSLEELRKRVRWIARLLESTQPAMGIFRRWSTEWRRFASEARPSRLRRRIDRWIRIWRAELRREPPALLRVARRRFPAHARVLTISRSASVFRALAGLPRRQRPREVIALESRPGGEGRLLARELRSRGLTVRLVPDAEGVHWVREVDRVVIGADTIYADGSVVHKVGTRRLAISARRRGVPVVVVSGLSKVVARTRPARPLPALFDITPARAITEYWTNRGVLRGGPWRTRPHPEKLSRGPT